MKNIYFGGGCFWCIEAVFQRIKGVSKVVSGYSAGATSDPNYREVSSGKTNHAEVVLVQYDPEIISLKTLLHVFFTVHDPTTLNQQGADKGTQYRSIILYDHQQDAGVINGVIQELDQAEVWKDPIVTQVEAVDMFYPAEDYHQNYYDLHENQPYCQAVINPKLAKLRNSFKEYLK